MSEQTPALSQIEEFVRKAAPLAWPNGVGPASSQHLPGFWESAATIGDFAFVDLFGGARTDVGFEAVLYQNKLIWGACYRGGLHRPETGVDEIYAFLGRALDARPTDAIPVRGPAEYAEPGTPWVYRHQLTGDFSGFTSLERIYEDGHRVYERITVGGLAGDDAPYSQWIDLPDIP